MSKPKALGVILDLAIGDGIRAATETSFMVPQALGFSNDKGSTKFDSKNFR